MILPFCVNGRIGKWKMTDIAIIGGGFFGCYLAEHLSKKGYSVTIFEAKNNLLQGASSLNQARVHNGYHYPRSIMTGARSRLSYSKFSDEFSEATIKTHTHRYLVARSLSKVSAQQFEAFCRRIGAYFDTDSKFLNQYCDRKYIEAAYLTEEAVFDANILNELMIDRIKAKKNIDVKTNSFIDSVEEDANGINLYIRADGQLKRSYFKHVFCCAYDGINAVLRRSKKDQLPFKQEFTEICIVDTPTFMKDSGLTVMCGPFFSILPHPISGKYSFSHVRFTPQVEYWDLIDKDDYDKLYASWEQNRRSNFLKIRADASRFLPLLKDVNYDHSQWTVKTVLQASEQNDSRPIFIDWNTGINNFHCVLGGKIDNVYDMITYIDNHFLK